jgi:cytochrome oxidase Cu insertion factor (SCO1/SenC/PrrC family)
MICGLSSCAAAEGSGTTQLRTATHKNAQCKILENADALGSPVATRLALNVVVSGEISMKVNDKAPDFTLQDENGKEVALKDLRGKTVVLFFYPRASTPG